MDKVLEDLREVKKFQEENSNGQTRIIDIKSYGKISFPQIGEIRENEREIAVYLVEKEVNGKIEFEIRTKESVIAIIGENNEIIIEDKYNNLISQTELLLKLKNIIPLSLEKLEQIKSRYEIEPSISERTRSIEKNKTQATKNINEAENTNERNRSLDANLKQNMDQDKKDTKNDIEINLSRRITEDKTFAQLVPEIQEKHIEKVKVRRVSTTKFEFYGLDADGKEIPIESLKQTEGTNPKEDIIRVNQDGSEVKLDTAYTMVKIQYGTNQHFENEGFIVKLGDYGIPEIDYYRRDPQKDEYVSVPVNLKTTNQKRTDKDVREFATKRYNPNTNDNIQESKLRIQEEDDQKTVLENIDDDNTNNIEDYTENLIQKAAKRCNMTVEGFRKEYQTAKGDTVEEKIQNAEEEINEQYMQNSRSRA